MLMILPQYDVTFFPSDSRAMKDQIVLCCVEDEVRAIVPVLLRSGYADFQVRPHWEASSQDSEPSS